jgi:hypothetical protein
MNGRIMKSMLTKVALLLAFFAPLAIYAQDTASLTGVVSDASGAVIPGTAVVLSNPHTGVSLSQTTDSKGSYRFSNVPPGAGYLASFTHSGFAATRIANVSLEVGLTQTQNAILQAGTAETVEVNAAGDVTINTTDATVGNNVNPEVLNDLPVQVRDSPSALFTLQPGVSNGDTAGASFDRAGSVTGSRTDQDQVTVDGLDVNDMATGQPFDIVAKAPVDAMQQFTGTVSGFNVGSGPGGGGQFQLVTRNGTDHFHGNINEYHRDAAMAANSWFGDHLGLAKPNYIRNQFGGALGGPMLKHDRAFFFFNIYDSRIVQSALVNRTVPLANYQSGNIGYVLTTDSGGNPCPSNSRQDTNPQCIGYYTPAQIAMLDPAGIGENAAFFTLLNSRYPLANNPAGGGDGVNTGYYSFTTPEPDNEINYTGRIDFNLTKKHRVYAFATVNREDAIESAPEFPQDGTLAPYFDRSYRWGVVDDWAINGDMANQVSFGYTVSDLDFPRINSNPNGTNLLTFGDGITSPILSDPWLSPINGQGRRIPIPQIADNLQWLKHSHSIQIGGFFKFITAFDHTTLDYNSATIGLGGSVTGLSAGERPSDILASSTVSNNWDNAFAAALGRVGAIGQQFNYTASGTPLPLATGDQRHYRYYQSELYVGDNWKVTPSLTLSYGVNWQYFSVPYETNGLESVGQIVESSGTAVPFTFNRYFSDRVNAANIQGPFAVPLIQYVLGGKANNGPGYYDPEWHDFAPRFAFAYSPSWDRKSVFNGGVGLVYDRTIINAVQYQQDQHNYLFQQSVTVTNRSLATDPRLGPNATYTAPGPPPAAKPPFAPFVDDANGDFNGTPNLPYGLQNGQAFNTMIDSHFRTPYNLIANLGFQHQFEGGFVMKLNYAGRFGRRLLGQADANQVLDNADPASGQLLSQAMTNATLQARACSNACAANLTAQPWFENVAGPGISAAFGGATPQDFGVANWTSWLAYELGTLIYNGDLADTVQAAIGGYNAAQPYNAGMSPQFSENTAYTNKGFSSYNGLLVTLHKNMTRGLTFDFNYTFSHSIDNVSLIANQGASGGYGFVCDALRPRECRGNSDFDVAQIFNGYLNYQLPIGHGRAWASSTPAWLDWIIGGWETSAIFNQHTGFAWGTVAAAFVPSYSNDAPAFFNGVNSDVRAHISQSSSGQVSIFSKGTATASEFSGPLGFNVGSRNNLRGPGYFDMDAGLAKTFAIVPDRGINLQFRGDFYNVLNHPSFSTPTQPSSNSDITNSNFGVLTTTASTARVGQVSARLEF